MNRERLEAFRKAAAWLRDTPELPTDCEFGMAVWHDVHECQTTMCLAGWYVSRHPDCGIRFGPPGDGLRDDTSAPWDSVRVLQRHFDLPDKMLSMIVFSHHYPVMYDRHIVAAMAVERLDAILGGCTEQELRSLVQQQKEQHYLKGLTDAAE